MLSNSITVTVRLGASWGHSFSLEVFLFLTTYSRYTKYIVPQTPLYRGNVPTSVLSTNILDILDEHHDHQMKILLNYYRRTPATRSPSIGYFLHFVTL